MTFRISISIIAMVGVAACALPEDNTLSRSDLAAFTADDERANNLSGPLSFTPAADIPTGSATYEGHVRSDAIVNGEDDYSILGLLELEVNIRDTTTQVGSGSIRGNITELNLIDENNDGFDDQAFTRDLSINGTINGGRIDATATGVLGAVLDDTISEQTSTWSLDLDGDVKTDFEAGDTLTGSISGGTAGASSDEYDVLLTGGGGFLAERQ